MSRIHQTTWKISTEEQFEFNEEIYLQKQGTAMGTRMAPNYAIIFMHKIESEILQGTAMGTRMAPNYAIIFMHKIESEILDKTPLKPKFFKRFIDDIFIIWPAPWRRKT